MSERQCVDCKEMVDISDLTEEMAELRAEIERLQEENEKLLSRLDDCSCDNSEMTVEQFEAFFSKLGGE